MSFNKHKGRTSDLKSVKEIAISILELAFGDDNKANTDYSLDAIQMISNDINKLRNLKYPTNETKMMEIIVSQPENGGWIKAFYDFHLENFDNTHDVKFIYKDVEIIAKAEDIVGWAKKWTQYIHNLSSLRLLMKGGDNWNGKKIIIEHGVVKYTSHDIRLRLFGKDCANKDKNISKCYGKVYMHERYFTKTKNDSGLCKYCESLTMKIKITNEENKGDNKEYIKKDDFDKDLELGTELAKKVALQVLKE